MNRRRSTALVSGLALLASTAFGADETQRTPVYLVSTAREIYGKQFVYHIRELLRASRGLALTESEDDASYQVRILAIDDDPNGIAYSVVWTMRGINNAPPSYVTHSVGTCGRNALQSCAQTVIASTDEHIQEDAKVWTEFFKELAKAKAAPPKQ